MSIISGFEKFRSNLGSSPEGFLPMTKTPNTEELSKMGESCFVGQGMCVLVGGLPGTGKTAFVDDVMLLRPYLWAVRNNRLDEFSWIYRSMERPSRLKMAKWTAYILRTQFNIVCDVPTLMGWPNKMYDINDKPQVAQIIDEHVTPMIEQMSKHVLLIDGTKNPTGLYATALAAAHQDGYDIRSNGESYTINKPLGANSQPLHEGSLLPPDGYVVSGLVRLPYKVVRLDGLGEIKVVAYQRKFYPTRKVLRTHIVDNINLIDHESGMNTDKAAIDGWAKYGATMRDVFDWLVIDISQFNQGQEDVTRVGSSRIDIRKRDFKGSGKPAQNADLMIGLLNPHELRAFDFLGYDIARMYSNHTAENMFRAMKIVKNSYGKAGFYLGMGFYGECGYTQFIPKSDLMTDSHYNALMQGRIYNLPNF